MNEWYVYSEAGRPFEVVLGRMDAVRRLLKEDADGRKFPTTDEEKRAISRFLENPVCDLGGGVSLVGLAREWNDGVSTDPVPDRKITRVIGPGTEV